MKYKFPTDACYGRGTRFKALSDAIKAAWNFA